MNDAIEALRLMYPWPPEKPDMKEDDHGWCRGDIVNGFEQLVKSDMRVILELGSWLGQSARLFHRLAPMATIICIDHWGGNVEHYLVAANKRRLPTLYDQFLVNMWDLREQLIPVREKTLKGMDAVRVAGITPDAIYVDASHDPASVEADIAKAAALWPGVTLFGDDWQMDGVRVGVWRAEKSGACKAVPIREHGTHWWSFTKEAP